MVLVPAGPFEMGFDADVALAECQKFRSVCWRNFFEDEEPVHTVTLDAFYIDQNEVTNAHFRRCVEADACQAPTRCDFGEPTYEDETKEDHPVVCVGWEQAKTYCEWREARLPTEAEWEKAARGPEGRSYPWGDTFDGTRLNYCDSNCEERWADKDYNDGYAETAPVSSYPDGISPYGAYDMAGNVWEWVQSEFRDYPYRADDGREGLDGTSFRVLRGGGWDFIAFGVRAAYRIKDEPSVTISNYGFRCVR
jgi:formylglycine-generating enzyme required for sulfatase activity